MRLEGRDDRLPETGHVAESAITLTPVTIEELTSELTRNPAIRLRLALPAVLHVPLALGIVDQQVDFPADAFGTVHSHSSVEYQVNASSGDHPCRLSCFIQRTV